MKDNILLKFLYASLLLTITSIILYTSLIHINFFDYTNVQIINMLFVMITGLIIGSRDINISGTHMMNSSEVMAAFIFLSTGIYSTVLFAFILVLIRTFIIDHYFMNQNNKIKKLLFIPIFMIPIYAAGIITKFCFNESNKTSITSVIIISFAYIASFYLFNFVFYRINKTIISSYRFKYYMKSKRYLIINLTVSFFVTVILYTVFVSAGIIGSIVLLLAFIITQYCFFLSRKLKIKEESIKKILKITENIIKIGNFKDKCKHLVGNLNSLIPYNICAIYEFDIDNDDEVYPIACNEVSGIDLNDLLINLSNDDLTMSSIKKGRIYYSSDTKKDKYINIRGHLYESMNSLVMIPICIGSKVVGIILLGGNQEFFEYMRNGFNDILKMLANQMAVAIENDLIFDDIKNKAEIDELTGIYNRRVFDRESMYLIENKRTFSLAIFDVDNFKNINDTYGHLFGDKVLRGICKIMKNSTRKADIVCRYGGEEIVIIFKELSKENALIISNRIRQKVEDTSLSWTKGKFNITISGGVSSYPEDSESLSEIISFADDVLYNQCKSKGKNKVCAYEAL